MDVGAALDIVGEGAGLFCSVGVGGRVAVMKMGVAIAAGVFVLQLESNRHKAAVIKNKIRFTIQLYPRI